MMTKWRVIKKAVEGKFCYVGLEFDLEQGEMRGVKIRESETEIRKKTTSQFEVLENGEWINIPTKDVKGLISDFNKACRALGKMIVSEQKVLNELYRINNL